jgi:NAD(P)-dependent dehydrogenase (short-subunit alcohol dehydrogenase family)
VLGLDVTGTNASVERALTFVMAQTDRLDVHANNAMNERYTHLDVDMQDKALEKLSRAA